MKSNPVIAGMAFLAIFALAGPALADDREVLLVAADRTVCPAADFTSIQAAVDAARPGSEIRVCAGTYAEQVTITKNDLRIRGEGEPGEVRLRGAVHHPEFGLLLQDVSGVRIEGFDIRFYHEAGIRIVGGGHNRIKENVTAANSHDGIQLLGSSFNRFEDNLTFGNSPAIPARACGIQILEGRPSNFNLFRHNTSHTNAFGIRLENGIGNEVIENDTSHNRRFGIWIRDGANDTLVKENRALGNVGTEGRGIAVTQSTGVSVVENRAFDNTIDLFWDGLGENTFEENQCNSSVPSGLCADSERDN